MSARTSCNAVLVAANKVCGLSMGHGGDHRWLPGDADVRLYEAAPALADACVAALDMVRNCPGNWQTQVADMLAAALRAAGRLP